MKVMVDHKIVFKEENTTPFETNGMRLMYNGYGAYDKADAKIRKLFVRTWKF